MQILDKLPVTVRLWQLEKQNWRHSQRLFRSRDATGYEVIASG